jgi:hypothetical protein
VASIGDENARCAPAPKMGAAVKGQRSFDQSTSLKERLIVFARELREKALRLPSGLEKEDLLPRARRAESHLQVDDWLSRPRQGRKYRSSKQYVCKM